jgi:hypothetical protein
MSASHVPNPSRRPSRASRKLTAWTPHCAVGDAWHDIHKGKSKIYVHGDLMSKPVGIPSEYYPLIRHLPKEHQLTRSANEKEALLYMKNYNQNVLLHLLRKKGPLSQHFPGL